MSTILPAPSPPASATPLPSPITIKGQSYAALGIPWTDAPGQHRLEAHFYYPRCKKPLILWQNADYVTNQEWTTATALARIKTLEGATLDACF